MKREALPSVEGEHRRNAARAGEALGREDFSREAMCGWRMFARRREGGSLQIQFSGKGTATWTGGVAAYEAGQVDDGH